MDALKLTAAGLSSDEAELYLLLLERGPQTAGELLKSVRMKRSSLYQVLRQLSRKNLASETERGKKILFSPESPDRLLERLRERKDELARAEEGLQSEMEELKSVFLTSTERPVLKSYHGIEGLKSIYEMHLDAPGEIWFLRAVDVYAYQEQFGKWWVHYLRRRAKKGIVAHGLTPDTPGANHDPKLDAANKVLRTWLMPEDYDAPVEINVFGDTVAIICFGKEIFGLTLENEPMARGFREMFKLMRRGAHAETSARDRE